MSILNYTEDTAPTSDDMVYVVNDPTSPADRKVTIGNLGKAIILESSNSDPAVTGKFKHDSTDTDVNSGGSWKGYDGAQVNHLVKAGTNYTYLIKTVFIPVSDMEDGAAPPAAASVLSSTHKARIRDFDGASNENLEILWICPDDYVGGIKFRFIGYVSNGTAPAITEIVAFSLAGNSLANSEIISGAVGTAQTSSLTADATYVQYDRLAGAYSTAIVVTGIAAGENVHFTLIRLAESTDTYAQDFGLAGIEIKYQAKVMLNSTY
jgi:hypothetical protein